MVARDGYTLMKVFQLFNPTELNYHYVYAPRYLCNIITGENPKQADQIEAFAGYYREALYHEEKVHGKYSNEDNLIFIMNNQEKIKSLSQKKQVDYLNYLSQFGYNSKKLAVVDLITTYYTSLKLFQKIYPQKYIVGYYWTLGIGAKKEFQIKVCNENMEQAKPAPWAFMEFLFTAPEFPIKDITDTRPVYKNTNNINEQFRIEVYPHVSDGIVKFVKDVRTIFGDIDVNLTQSLVTAWVEILRTSFTKSDARFLRDLRCSTDVDHSEYNYIFKSWH